MVNTALRSVSFELSASVSSVEFGGGREGWQPREVQRSLTESQPSQVQLPSHAAPLWLLRLDPCRLCLWVCFSCDVTAVERRLENTKPCTQAPSKRLKDVRDHAGPMCVLMYTCPLCIYTYMMAHVHMYTQHMHTQKLMDGQKERDRETERESYCLTR